MAPADAIALLGLVLTLAMFLFGWWIKHSLGSAAERELKTLRDDVVPTLRKKLDDCEAQHRQTREDYAHVRDELRAVREHLEQSRARVEELTRERLDVMMRLIERRDGKIG